MSQSDNSMNSLLRAMPDNGPGRIVIAMIVASVAVTTHAATYLLGANEAILAAIVVGAGLVVALLLFIGFRSYLLDEQCFRASLPYELDTGLADKAFNVLEELQKETQRRVGSEIEVRANIFRPSAEFQQYGCAVLLKIDPQLQIGMSQLEIASVQFLPNQGHTGTVFVTTRPSSGSPRDQIASEQFKLLEERLAYITSFPIKKDSAVLGVLNVDFCTRRASPSDTDKDAVVKVIQPLETGLQELAVEKAKAIGALLGKGKLRSVRLLRSL